MVKNQERLTHAPEGPAPSGLLCANGPDGAGPSTKI